MTGQCVCLEMELQTVSSDFFNPDRIQNSQSIATTDGVTLKSPTEVSVSSCKISQSVPGALISSLIPVVVQVWVGKEFPDMRQNEREIKFIQNGRCCQNSGTAQGRADIGWGSLVYFYTQGTRSGLGVLGVICQLDEAHVLGGEKSKANHSSLWGMRGDRLCRSINSYNMGEGRVIRVLSLHFCIPRASLVLSAHPSLVTTTPTGIWAHGGFYNQDATRGKGEDILRMMKMKFSNEISEQVSGFRFFFNYILDLVRYLEQEKGAQNGDG